MDKKKLQVVYFILVLLAVFVCLDAVVIGFNAVFWWQRVLTIVVEGCGLVELVVYLRWFLVG